MELKKLFIANYRNIEEADLSFSSKLNCFVGPNGVGKTNLLDAIYYLSFCRSALGQTNSQVLRHGADWMSLSGDYVDDSMRPLSIRCALKAGHRKSFKKNGKEYKKQSEHIGLIPLVMVSPQDNDLIVGGGEARRKFMDMVISQYAPSYLHSLIRYNQALQQRNALLRAEAEPDETLLAAYDDVLCECGEEIFRHRKAFVDALVPIFRSIYLQLGGEGENVSLAYRSHLSEGGYRETLLSFREKDRIMGFTLKGIHRDDLEMGLGGFPLRYEGSQGQVKTYLIALKFSQYLLLGQRVDAEAVSESASVVTAPVSGPAKRRPILLLDDIFDKLDAGRVEKIVRLVCGDQYGQIFITSTSRRTLRRVVDEAGGDYRFFSVNDGAYTLMD